MAYPRNGSASRAVALDLMLRTFMNSADFHTSNPKIWENIAKLVPGTTPLQCSQRWDELRLSNSTVARDLSGLSATGRPISSHGRKQISQLVRSMLNQPGNKHGSLQDLPPSSTGYPSDTRPHTSMLSERSRSFTETSTPSRPTTAAGDEDSASGHFVANFCQTVLSGSVLGGSTSSAVLRGDGLKSRTEEGVKRERNTIENGSATTIESEGSSTTIKTPSINDYGPSMVIHVCDEAKKLKRDFVCPREILVQEMHYFAEYLSSDTQLWDEVDISVHCDVPVFDWLMRYTKRGLLEGPCGERLDVPQETPALEPSNAISILISSDFLKMNTLVELCLDYCHAHIASVVAAPCNMNCIKDKLITRLGARFSPLEAENLVDKKDKVKSKLFLYQLEQLFQPSNSTPQCPSTGTTLHKCKHCQKLLTTTQCHVLPCVTERLTVDRTGRVVYSHEPDSSWELNKHIQLLQQREGLTPRDIYWRLWGVINTLSCDQCHQVFQCCQLPLCSHHPRPALGSEFTCCNRPVSTFSPLPHTQTGCTYRDHTVSSHSSHQNPVYTILLQLRDTICAEQLKLLSESPSALIVPNTLELILQQGEEGVNRPLTSRCVSTSNSSHHMTSSVSAESVKTPTRHLGLPRQRSHDLCELEEDEDDGPVVRSSLHVPTTKHKKGKIFGVLRQRSSREAAPLPPPVEWIWDSRKSKRWNQDMQRESDERRLASLEDRLSQSIPPTTGRGEVGDMAGGMFSRLEVQFRAQQAAKALQQQQGQHSRNIYQGSGRRKAQSLNH